MFNLFNFSPLTGGREHRRPTRWRSEVDRSHLTALFLLFQWLFSGQSAFDACSFTQIWLGHAAMWPPSFCLISRSRLGKSARARLQAALSGADASKAFRARFSALPC